MPSLIRPQRSNTADMDPPGMKRRKSSVPSLKSLPLAFRMKRKNTGTFEVQPAATEPMQASLLTLPTELQLQIAQHLSFSDLCSLRTVSRDSNQLITGPESAIARYWIVTKLHQVHRLYPAPSQDQWQYLTSQMHRWHTARHLAEMIAYHIQYKTLLYVQRHSPSNVLSSQVLAALLLPPIHSAQKKSHAALKGMRFHPVAIRLRRRLTPLLFTISHYLSSCQSAIVAGQINLAQSGGKSRSTWSEIEAPEHYQSYTLHQLLSTHYCYLFLEWIFNSLLARPSYAGTIERAVRGWTAAPLDRVSLNQVLVHGNLGAVKQLFRQKDYGERKKWANTFLRKLNPETNNLAWSEEWTNMSLRTADMPTKAEAVAIAKGPTKDDSLWTQGAAERLKTLGVELEENELHGNVATTMRFLTEMVGFDLFHEEPPEDINDDDSDSDGELPADASERDDGTATPPDEEQYTIAESPEEGTNYWDV